MFLILSLWLSALFFFLCYLDKLVDNVINDSVYHALGLSLSPSLYLFPSSGVGSVRNLFTASSDGLFYPPLSLVFFFQSSSSPASSHLSQHSPPISALASLVSSCPPHVTLPLSSVVCHPPSFLRVLPTVVCSSPVSLSSSSALLSALATLAIFRTQLFSHTFSLYVVVVRSLPRFPFRTGMLMSHHTNARDLALSVFLRSAGPPSPLNCSPRVRSGVCSPT